ncbi:hypothetical protein [Bacillus sp. OK048]|uniref:hypothetical protein n=1 Tax=Bacillus sp. OK048 TaxID=1882761 RepID=UPI00088D8AEA|nr:hypothetical protein [Bacillus sp. OK048]SDN63665.1 hypothetical protein SAMN05443253_11569 [Bacillus sp. OK048]
MPGQTTELVKIRRQYSSKSFLDELKKEEEEKDKKREDEIKKHLAKLNYRRWGG